MEEIIEPSQADAANRQATHTPDDARRQGRDERARDSRQNAQQEDCADDHLGGGELVHAGLNKLKELNELLGGGGGCRRGLSGFGGFGLQRFGGGCWAGCDTGRDAR